MRLQTAGLMLVVMHARALLAPNGRRVFADAARRCKYSQRLRTLAASRSDLEQLTVPVLKDRLRAQGLKVGGKKAELVERLVVWAHERGFAGVELEAYRMNTAASVLYRSLDFRRIARERYSYDMANFDWVLDDA